MSVVGPVYDDSTNGSKPFDVVWEVLGNNETLRVEEYSVQGAIVGGLMRGAQTTFPPQAHATYGLKVIAVNAQGIRFQIACHIQQNKLNQMSVVVSHANGGAAAHTRLSQPVFTAGVGLGFRTPYLGRFGVGPSPAVTALQSAPGFKGWNTGFGAVVPEFARVAIQGKEFFFFAPSDVYRSFTENLASNAPLGLTVSMQVGGGGFLEDLTIRDYEFLTFNKGPFPNAPISYTAFVIAEDKARSVYTLSLEVVRNALTVASVQVSNQQHPTTQLYYDAPNGPGHRAAYRGSLGTPFGALPQNPSAMVPAPSAPVTPEAQLRAVIWDLDRPFHSLLRPPKGYGMNPKAFDAITAARDRYLSRAQSLLRHPSYDQVPASAVLVSIEPLFGSGRTISPSEAADGFRVTFWTSGDFLSRGKLARNPGEEVLAIHTDGSPWSDCNASLTGPRP